MSRVTVYLLMGNVQPLTRTRASCLHPNTMGCGTSKAVDTEISNTPMPPEVPGIDAPTEGVTGGLDRTWKLSRPEFNIIDSSV